MYSGDELFQCPWEGYFGVYWNNDNKHQNNTRVSAEKVRYENTYIILFFT